MSHPGMRLDVDELGNPRLVQYFSLCGVWAVTPYTACDLRCSYCITFSQGKSLPRMTTGVSAAIAREVSALPPDATIALGGLVDAYPTVEDEFGMTREVLRGLVDCNRPVVVVTKGPAITRDIDLLLAGDMRVSVSLSSLDDRALQEIEPYVAPASARMAAIEALAEAGVDVTLQAQPWIPGLTNAEKIIEWADDRFSVSFTPINVDSPGVARTKLGRHYKQTDINRLYIEERQRLKGRANVTWHKPLWIGTTDLDDHTLCHSSFHPQCQTSEHGTDNERRNLASIKRLLYAFDEDAQFEALLGLISPYVRGHDLTGHATDRHYPGCGRTYDLLYALHDVLDEPAMSIHRLTASGDSVDLSLEISGIHNKPLFDIEPSGEAVTLQVDYHYEFDHRGLILDYTQNAKLDQLQPAQVTAL